MFLYGNIISVKIAMFTFVNIAAEMADLFPNGKISVPHRTARLLEILELVRREGKRDDEAFARLRCCGDVDAHFGA